MNDLKNKKLLIFGTGAVGGYYGGMLVKAGFDVTFTAHGKNYEALKQNGLMLIRENKKESLQVKVFEDTKDLGLFDYIFICVKSMDTKETVKKIKTNLDSNTTVVSLQNGVENEDIIGGVIGIEKVIGALVFVASKLTEPGIVYQFGYNGCLIGELNCKKTERIIELQKILLDAGIDCKISEDIRADFWNKLVWNASFNPLSVLTLKTVDKILEEDHELVKNIMTEVRDVALAIGLKIRPDTVEFNLERSKRFTGFKTSMLQDFERGKPIELEEIVGVVIRKAKEKNISVPNIQKIYNQIKEKMNNPTASSGKLLI